MSSTNFDASLTTQRRKQIALYGWRRGVQYPENPTTVKPEQAPAMTPNAGPTSSVGLNVYMGAQLIGQTPGACPCSASATLAGYVKKAPAY